jgi:2-dehydropantoate 2-reductase
VETLILGPGALGCTLARHLQNRVPVHLLGPRAPRSPEFTALWQPEPPDHLEAPTFIWLACKAPQIAELIESVLRSICRNTPQEVLHRSLLIAPQNGLGIAELLTNANLDIPLCRAVAWFGARWEGRELLETPPPRRITLATEAGPQAHALQRILSQSGFTMDVIEGEQSNAMVEWKKALTSIALNPVLALAGAPNGAMLDSAELQSQARALQDEALRVFKALGLHGFSRDEAWSDLIQTCRETATNRNSMLQDLEAGRPLELAFLNRWILSRAEQLGLEVPRHCEIVGQLKAADQKS